MRRMNERRATGAVIGLVAALFLAGLVSAHGSLDRLKGRIDAIGSSSLSVLGETILADGATEVEDQNENHIPFSSLKVGDNVKIEGTRLSDGTMMAEKIELEGGQQEPQEVEIRGTIDSIGTNLIVIGGTTIIVGAGTAVLGNENQALAFDSLQAGQLVEVEGALQGDGSILAGKIKIEDHGDSDSLRIGAEIERLGSSSIDLIGHRVLIDSSTDLRGRRNLPISFADLKLGVYATVEGPAQPDGSLLARTLNADVNPSKGGEEVVGKISAKGSNFIKVGGRKFLVRASTKIEDAASEPMSFSRLRVGMKVRVEYRKVGSTFVAKEINVL